MLIIDEVDSASNNQVFVDFLAQLRRYYLNRDNTPIFHSVILAGVYDIKNLKLKLRPDEEHQYNSPWNIAARFTVDMSFSAHQIAVMLEEYEKDGQICIDTERAAAWTKEGIAEAIKLLLNENTPIFGSMIRNLSEYPELKQMLYAILFQGERVAYNPDNNVIELACMFDYAVNVNGNVRVANRIFETRLYNFFLSEEELASTMSKAAKQNSSRFIANDRLDMNLVLEKFIEYFTDIYGENDEKFVESYGRKFFLLYLKPIINGTGNYYIEAQTRDAKRTDVIVEAVV